MRLYFLKIITVCTVFLFLPMVASAQNPEDVNGSFTDFKEESFRARVVEVTNQREATDASGSQTVLQDLTLVLLDGSRKGEQILFKGLTENITTKQPYSEGQILLVTLREGGGVSQVYIDDVWRVNSLYYLAALFLIAALLVGRKKGIRSLLSLVLTFVVIFKFTIPFISLGNNPVLITLASSLFIILTSMIFLYGWNAKSKAAVVSIIISVTVATILSYLFIKSTNLTGFGEEEAVLLADSLKSQEGTFSGLLLVAFVLGALGILDDVVLTQISAVEQLKQTDSHLHAIEVYKRAMKIGTDHIASMINTLFLAYASSAFFLMFLIQSKQPPFNSFLETINNEVVATEVVRVLVGSTGLILAIPITTYIASFYYFKHLKK